MCRLTGTLFKRKVRLDAGLDAADVQFAFSVSPGSYLSLSVTIVGFSFGSSKKKTVKKQVTHYFNDNFPRSDDSHVIFSV